MKNTSCGLSRAAAVLWAAVLSGWLLTGYGHTQIASPPDAGKPAGKEGPGTRPPVVVENEMLRITVDADLGVILGITNRKTNTEYLTKAAILGITNRKTNTEYLTQGRAAKPPFILDTYSANQAIYIRDPFERQSGGFSLYNPAAPAGSPGDLAHVRDAVPGGVSVAKEEGGDTSRVTAVHSLAHGIVVTYSITVRKNSPLTEWKIQVDNRGGETPANDRRVYRVAFPVLEGLRIGDRHEANYLARPYAQGELIPDPASYAFTRPKSSVPINVLTYIGWASMPWQDLYAADGGGLYLASYDKTFQQVDLETWPDRDAGSITIDMRTLAFLEPGQSWTSQPFEVAVHEGDWHWARRPLPAVGRGQSSPLRRSRLGAEGMRRLAGHGRAHAQLRRLPPPVRRRALAGIGLPADLVGDARKRRPQQVAKAVLLLPLARPRPRRRGGIDPRGPRRACGRGTYRLLPQHLDLGLGDGEEPGAVARQTARRRPRAGLVGRVAALGLRLPRRLADGRQLHRRAIPACVPRRKDTRTMSSSGSSTAI